MSERMVRLAAMFLALGVAGAAAVAADDFDQRYGLRLERIDFPAIYRIGLMEGSDRVSFDAPTDGWVRAGDAVEAVPAGARVGVTRLTGAAATIRYRLCVGTFDAGRLEEADRRVEELRAEGIEARLIPFGAYLVNGARRPVHDNRRVFVAVEATEDLAHARKRLQAWTERGFRPFVKEALRAAPEARVRVQVEGREVYRGPAPVNFSADGGAIRVYDVRAGLVPRVRHGVEIPVEGGVDRLYRGSMVVAADRAGSLATVNVVELEDYLRGVVPAEIGPSSPREALRAQAVAARGESVAKYGLRHLPDPYYLCATTHCQVYGGKSRETDRTNEAVDVTRGEVMRYGDHIVDAVYAAVCGGHTEHNENVWSSPPDAALRGRRDGTGAIPSPVTAANLEAFLADRDSAWCKDAPGKFRWEKTLDQAELRAGLAARGIDVGRIRDMALGDRGVSGRLRWLEVVGDEGKAVIRKELPIRLAFDRLRSALFALELTRDGRGFVTRAHFRGAGWGHGVGLCQIGARAQAAAGVSYREILKDYYAGIEVVPVDREPGLR